MADSASVGVPDDLLSQAADMEPGEWRRLDTANKFFDVAVTEEEWAELIEIHGGFERLGEPRSVLGAWNGAAYDIEGQRLFFHGGGHGDYGGNEVYQFDLETLEWSRISDPAPLTLRTDEEEHPHRWLPADEDGDGLPDSPPSAHTYDGLVWNPHTETLWLTSQNTAYPENRSPELFVVWEFDPETGEWQSHAATEDHSFGTTNYLADTQQILAITHYRTSTDIAYLYDSDGTEHQLGQVQGDTMGGNVGNMFQNPITGQLYEAHAEGIYKLDVGDAGVTATLVAEFPSAEELQYSTSFKQAGYAFNPADEKFYIWNGTAKIVTWDPESTEFEVLWNEAPNGQAPADDAIGVGKVLDKWIYHDDADVFIGIAGAEELPRFDGGLWLYKPGDGNPDDINQLDTGDAFVDGRTTESVSFFVPVEGGDKNYDGTIHVYYREVGDSEWEPGIELLRLRPEFVSPVYSLQESPEGFAGMVTGLDAGTDYEFKLETKDPDGLQTDSGPAEQILNVSTRDVPLDSPQQAQTVTVETMAELKAAVAAAQPGSVIILLPGRYEGQLNVVPSGTEDNPIIIRGADLSSTILDAGGGDFAIKIDGSHVQIENLSLTNAHTGINLRGGGTEGVVIRDNYIFDVENGINAWTGHKDLYIANNVLEGRGEFPATGTSGVEGIVVTGQDIEIAYNTLSGFGDSIGTSRQTELNNIGINVHHNKILWGADDGIELDYSVRNVAAHHNLIANQLNGVSFQPTVGGPAYAFENVIYNTREAPFKIKPTVTDPDGLIIVNNTSIKSGPAWYDPSGFVSNVTVNNNLFVGFDERFTYVSETSYSFSEFDYNAWSQDGYFQVHDGWGESFEQFLKSTSHAQNDVLLEGEEIFANLELDFDVNGFEVFRDPDAPGLDFGLHPSSSAIDAGKEVFGLTEGFVGDAPDIGAFEQGEEMPDYGASLDLTPATAPIAIDDHAFALINGDGVAVNILANDFDPNGDALSVVELGDAQHGTLQLSDDGVVTYVPDKDYLGQDSFTYTVRDPNGETASATVTISVTPPNNAPNAEDDRAQTIEGEPVTISAAALLDNDSDPDGHNIAVTAVGEAAHGRAVLLGGTVLYTPDAGFVGTDRFTYTLTDERGGTDTAEVVVGVFSDGSIIGTGQRDIIDLSLETEQQLVLGRGGPDIVIGSQAGDLISGGAGEDRLNGAGGDDIFEYEGADESVDHVDGGSGYDEIRGSDGDDSIGLHSVKNVEKIDGLAGYDVIFGSINRDVLDFSDVEVVGIELIDAGHGSDIITGSQGDDVITGGSGEDQLYGSGGDDLFKYAGPNESVDLVDGGSGYDEIRGSEGDDAIGLFSLQGIEKIDGLAGYDVIFGSINRDVLDFSDVEVTGIELIDGRRGPDRITGSHSDDVISGGTGEDTLNGAGGNDLFLYAGADDLFDHVDGGSGYDEIRGSTGDDIIGLHALTGIERIDGLDGYDVLRGTFNSERLDFSGTELHGIELIAGGGGSDEIIGSQGNDRINGDSGEDWLSGEAGDDTLSGGSGDDRLDGGSGFDIVSYAEATERVVVRLDNLEKNAGAADGDELLSIEGVIGSDFNDYLRGDYGSGQRLEGLGGNDVFLGLSGQNSLFGGDGNDRFFHSGGNGDIIDGGSGTDTVYYTSASQGVVGDLSTGLLRVGQRDSDQLSNIENVYGSNRADIISGDANDNLFISYGGDDVLDGRGGKDRLFGRDGNDSLIGGDGDDRLYGDSGEDELAGGGGNDHLFGGADADIFIFGIGDGRDRIRDFDPLEDQIDLTAWGLSSFSEVTVTAKSSSTELTFSGSDKLVLDGIEASSLDDSWAIWTS